MGIGPVNAEVPPSGVMYDRDLLASLNVREDDPMRRKELRLYSALRELLSGQTVGRRLLVVCVGTPMNAGDSLGPLTGTFLQRGLEPMRTRSLPTEVAGTLEDPIHAMNLAQRTPAFTRPDTFVLAVDASTGTPGEVLLKRGPLRPGAGVGRDLPPVGHAHLLCGIAPLAMGFWCAHMGTVLTMAELVSRCVLRAAISTQAVGEAH